MKNDDESDYGSELSDVMQNEPSQGKASSKGFSQGKTQSKLKKSITKINIGEDYINKVSIKDVLNQKELQQLKEEFQALTRRFNKTEDIQKKQKTNIGVINSEILTLQTDIEKMSKHSKQKSTLNVSLENVGKSGQKDLD